MAKLVKMTSSAGLQPNSNSFTVRSDDDIIIAPNSSVALLNGFISSGIVADYKVDGDNTLGKYTGEILGSLYLNKDITQDRARTVLIPEGEYGISAMLTNMEDAFNRSLIYRNLPTTTQATSNTFNTPPEPDFGLEVGCSLNDAKQVSIKYNSAAQLPTANLDYSNKSNGVQVAANGDITYTTPGGFAMVPLDPAQANDATKTVYTVDDPTGKLVQFDTVSLSNATGTNVEDATIANIALDSTNTNYSIPLNTALADKVGLFVYSTKEDYTSLPPLPINQGQLITMDDGAGVLGTPSANTITGKVDIAPVLVPVNVNTKITETHGLTGLDLVEVPITVLNVVEVQPNTEYTLTVDVAFANAGDNHLLNDAIFMVSDKGNLISVIVEITDVVEDPTNPAVSILTVNASPIGGSTIELTDFDTLQTFEAYKTNENQQQDVVATVGDKVALFDATNVMLYSFEVLNITADANNSFLVEAAPGSCVVLSADGTTLLTGMDAMARIVDIIYSGTPVNPDLQNVNLFCMDKFLTDIPVDLTADFKAADVVVFGDDPTASTATLKVDSAQFTINGDIYTLFQIDDLPADIDDYKFKRDLILFLMQTPTLYKTNNGKRIQFHLSNLVPDETKLDLMTRIWPGTNVQDTYAIQLRYGRKPANFTLANYELLLKGTIRPASGSYVVEDHRLSHSCGRVCFLITNADLCEMGFMPETIYFDGQTIDDNDFKITIEKDNRNNFVYKMYRGNTQVNIKTPLFAKDGDRVCISWGATTQIGGNEYVDGVDSNTNPAAINAGLIFNILNTDPILEVDAGKILVSILRTGASNDFIYLGCPFEDPGSNNADINAIKQTVPWTPRGSPYIAPQYWNNDADLHVYVCPNQATVRILELTPTPMITFVDGVYKEFDGTSSLIDTTAHAISDPEAADASHKLKSFSNIFDFRFTNIDLQRRLGYKTATHVMNGASGSWSAEISFMSAYLPENITVLLDTLSNVQSYDLEQNNGRRRNIIGVVVNSQDRAGEIVIEPSNLYKIKLGNKEPINLRRFVVSLEDFYGNQIRLQSARAVINLLFEEPTA